MSATTTTQRIRDYIKARDLVLNGSHETALPHLRAALGLEPDADTPIMERNLEKLTDPEHLAGDAVLRLIISSSRRANVD